jgi:hypothetical protein
MKNIHLLPTEKPSRLFKFANQLHLDTIPKEYYKKYNIYITNSEEIKEGDWCINLAHKQVVKPTDVEWANSNHDNLKKIMLTTDQDLIADGVQAIDDEFLEWFVKNPSCESVVVNFNYKKFRWSELNKSQCYKIIIPKEEPKQDSNKTHHLDELPNVDKDVVSKMYNAAIPKLEPKQETLEAAMYILQNSTYGAMGKVCDEEPKQETLEEAAENYVIDESYLPIYKEECERAFINGAKWQQEQDKNKYSEEEVYHILCEHTAFLFAGGKSTLSDWFEQFKKK